MSELRDTLRHSTASAGVDVARSLTASVDRDATWAQVTQARRRRTAWQASGAVAAVAVGAVALGAIASVGPFRSDPAAPLVDGVHGQCDLDSSPLPNVRAMPGAGFEGRVYADYTTDTFMFRALNGDLRKLVQDEQGTWRDPDTGDSFAEIGFYSPLYLEADQEADRAVFDRYDGSLHYVDDPTDLYYEWTTDVPTDTGVDVNLEALIAVHQTAVLGWGEPVTTDLAVGDPQVQHAVTSREADATTVTTTEVLIGDTAPQVDATSGLVSVATTATAHDGQTITVTSSYDASRSYAATCGPNESAWQANGKDPQDPQPNPNVMPVLSGPESGVFACDATLDPALQREPRMTLRRDGVVFEETTQTQINYGDGGVMIVLDDIDPLEDYTPPTVSLSPGWSIRFDGSDNPAQPSQGYYLFTLPVWVDAEGRIIGTSDPETLDDTFRVILGDAERPTAAVLLDASVRAGCGSADGDALAAASSILLTGYGPSVDQIDWAWYNTSD
ncbi:hypothetical protein [Demequina zhanjiangensis]|uniref:Ig-like domain-containing protein n=1 Tax=Demequina zhanjiangensis TaxID=3051659 RepID=A0ABT8G3V2_9MICO|nr:hypothetical protein [Demequina sp. SYSU T00b26]MDN4473805.1 hypothetical protein [Demequina sp. SYSU T00b26]